MTSASAPPVGAPSAPFLSLEPIQYSLTEGTNIPPPPPYDPSQSAQPKAAAAASRHPFRSREKNETEFGGPLSSHPVTPTEVADAAELFDRQGMGDQNTEAGKSPNGKSYGSNSSSDANNFDPALSDGFHPANDSSRKPGLVARIFRLRSSSFMRSKSSLGTYAESMSSVNTLPKGVQTLNGRHDPRMEQGRGLKRPASNASDAAAPATFPRVVRKKSLELLGTARRKSGMWGGHSASQQTAIEDEQAREKAQEAYMNGDGHSSALPNRTPPPAVEVKGLDGGTFMNADLFKGIGVEK